MTQCNPCSMLDNYQKHEATQAMLHIAEEEMKDIKSWHTKKCTIFSVSAPLRADYQNWASTKLTMTSSRCATLTDLSAIRKRAALLRYRDIVYASATV